MAVPPDFVAGQKLTAAQMNKVGMWLVKTQTVGTSVTTVTVSDAFTADFDSYFITYSGGTYSTENNLQLRLGSTTTGYYGNLIYGNYQNATITSVNDNNAGQFTFVGGGDNFNGLQASFYLTQPYQTKQTFIHAIVCYSVVNGTYVGRLANSTSYTAFTLIPATGNITGGTIRVYGYNQG